MNLEQGLNAIELLGHEKANEELKTIRNLIGDLFSFLIQARKIVYHLEQSCTNTPQRQALKATCQAYQAQKNY
ncbi:MAG: hypothetical protein ACI85O_003617 [Saprospiraceae bacterium]